MWLAVRLLHEKSMTRVVIGRRSFDYNRVLFAMGVGACLYTAWFLLESLVFQEEATFQDPNLWEYLTFLLFAIVLILCQAAFEEIFFRGYILQRMVLFSRNRTFLTSLSANPFVVPHLLNSEPWAYGVIPHVVSLLMFGGFMTLITVIDGGIELAVRYHALNNLFISLVANTQISAPESPSLFLVPIYRHDLFQPITADVMLYALAFLVFTLKYRRTWLGR